MKYYPENPEHMTTIRDAIETGWTVKDSYDRNTMKMLFGEAVRKTLQFLDQGKIPDIRKNRRQIHHSALDPKSSIALFPFNLGIP